jgi:polar amino acid transport system substrate-binding protein
MHVAFRVLSAAVAFCCGVACDAAVLVRLGYADVESYPYQVGNGDTMAKPPGISIEVIRQAADDLGIGLVFQRFPAKRLPVEMKAGRIDGAFIFSYSDERRGFARYPMRDGHVDAARRVARLGYYLYRLRGDTPDWNGEWFSGLKGAVGANAGFAIVNDLKRFGLTVDEAKSVEQNFTKLKMHRVAAVVAQDLTADAWLAQAGLSDIEKVAMPIEEADYFLVFNPAFAGSNAGLVERFWNRIGEIRDRKTRQVLPTYLKQRRDAVQ